MPVSFRPIARTLPSDPSGPTGRLSHWIHRLQLSDVPSQIVHRTKYLMLDGLGCAIVGAKLPWSKRAVNTVSSMESIGNCTVVGWNRRLGPLPAALLNSTFIQGFELDDVNERAPWHANAVVVPALLAAHEHTKHTGDDSPEHTGRDLLLATIVGFELGGRIGSALNGSDMLSKGWHSGAVFGPPAAAAAVARFLALSPSQIEDALGTACTQSCGLMSAQYEAMVKRMQHGFAARNGLFAALTARDNYTGIDKVFERPYGGYLSTFGQNGTQDNALRLVKGLGTDWSSIQAIAVKPYASMLGTHGPIDCISALQRKHPEIVTDPMKIKSIRIEQSEAWYEHGGQQIECPINVLGAQMSTRYCVAAQLLDGRVMPAQFSSARLNRDQLWQLVMRTSCESDPSLAGASGGTTRVHIEFEDGRKTQEESDGPRTTRYPLSNDEVLAKWRNMVDGIITRERMRRLERIILNLEDLKNVSELTAMLADTTHNIPTDM